MDIKEIRQKRLKHWFADKAIPPKEKSYLSQLMSGRASFGERAARRLESDYGMPVKYLDQPMDEGSNVKYIGPATDGHAYPLISWVSAGCWLEAVEPYRMDEIEDWPTTTVNASNKSFWLRVKGDSMTAPSGFSVPEGMIILVDPTKEANNGNLVVAKLLDENEVTFKKYIVDGGQFLQGLNPKWPLKPINGNCQIIGVVVDAKWEKMP